MLDAYIYDGTRTPFGRNAGSLSKVRPDDLLAGAIKAVVERSAFAATDFEDVNVGCANQAGEDSRCLGRYAALLAGLPIEVAGNTIQRNCGSGMNAMIDAARAITCGEGDLFIAGGAESMTRAPFVVGKAETAFAKTFPAFESSLGARFPNPKIEKTFGGDTMPETADNLARDFQLSREDCDTFACASQSKYQAAKKDGFYDGEITPVVIPGGRKGPDVTVAEDEHPRPKTDMETLGGMKALFQGGVTTAGNASGINDGAAALIVGSLAAGEKAGAKPRARILASGVAGVEPRIMGFGPVPAAQKALARAGLTIADMDVIEVNEAFLDELQYDD